MLADVSRVHKWRMAVSPKYRIFAILPKSQKKMVKGTHELKQLWSPVGLFSRFRPICIERSLPPFAIPCHLVGGLGCSSHQWRLQSGFPLGGRIGARLSFGSDRCVVLRGEGRRSQQDIGPEVVPWKKSFNPRHGNPEIAETQHVLEFLDTNLSQYQTDCQRIPKNAKGHLTLNFLS